LGFFSPLRDAGATVNLRVIREAEQPEVFRGIQDRNLFAQYDFLHSSVMVALLDSDYRVTTDIIKQLNYYAVVYICDEPGQYRTRPVHIKNSTHRPPPPDEVPGLMDDFIAYLNKNWKARTATHLAAYTLWRLNWIHPFLEGNGRAARAMCCLVMCVKLGFWLPGKNTIPKQIRDDRHPYYEALSEGDKSDPRIDFYNLETMERYLDGLVAKQLQS